MKHVTAGPTRRKDNPRKMKRKERELLVVKIVDFRDDPREDEPGFDVEIYKKGEFHHPGYEGVYSTVRHTEAEAFLLAKQYAIRQIALFKLDK